MYRLRKNTIGSVKLRVMGRTRTIMTISLPVICSPCNSGSQISLSLPVIFRRRRVRRYRILAEEVSGRKKKNNTKAKPDNHINSQIVHVHPFASAANPPTRGPSVGPHTAPTP
jgi:hypothetical protein